MISVIAVLDLIKALDNTSNTFDVVMTCLHDKGN